MQELKLIPAIGLNPTKLWSKLRFCSRSISEDTSLKAYPTVEYLANLNTEIFLIHVLEAPAAAARLFSSFDEAKERKHVNAQMDKLIKEKGNADIIYNKIIKVGKPWKCIIDAATELTANVIIMGTHGASGLGEIFAGTNAARVISTAPCPVITLQQQQVKPGFGGLVLPIDLTRETGEKLELGVEFAKNYSADLVIVSILQSKNERDKERLQNRMNKAVQHIQKQGVKVDSTMLVSKGDISKVVLDFADESGVDLIMIMTQQESVSNLRSTFLERIPYTWSTIPKFRFCPLSQSGSTSLQTSLVRTLVNSK